MEESSRPQNLNPSSLLWAHQLRREHVHIVNQIDSLRADIAAATETMNDLKESLEALSRQVEETEQQTTHNQANLLQLEDRLNGRLHSVLERINDLETENGVLKTRLEALERQREDERERKATDKVLPQQKKPPVKSPARRQTTVLKIACENGVFKRARTQGSLDLEQSAAESNPRLPDSDVLAPDSMPANSESSPLPLLRPEDFVRSLSETTLSSSYISGRGGKHPDSRGQMGSDLSNQGGGTRRTDSLTRENRSLLAAFWAENDRTFQRRSFSKAAEDVFVRDFVKAVPDPETRKLLQERCHTGCRSWNELRALVHEITNESEGEAGLGDCVMQPPAAKQDTSGTGNQTLKRKRHIPIVPPDQDEQLVIDAYDQGLFGPV